MNQHNTVPDIYQKIWMYMNDSNQHPNDQRIRSMLEEIMLVRLQNSKQLLKNAAKGMPIGKKFDLRNDAFLNEIFDYFTKNIETELVQDVKQTKAIPDVAQRAPKMRERLSDMSISIAPLKILSEMNDEYVYGTEPDSDVPPVDDAQEEDENKPGYLKRAGGYAKNVAGAGLAAAGLGLMGQKGMIGTLARGAGALVGLHKAAKSMASSSPSKPGRLSRSIKNLFGGKNTTVTPRSTDFTPREEQLEESGGVLSVLQRIKENTARLLEKFGGTAAKDGKGGILGSIITGMATALKNVLGTVLDGILKALLLISPLLVALASKLIPGFKLPSMAAAGAADKDVMKKVLPFARLGSGALMMLESGEAGRGSDIVGGGTAGRKLSDLSSMTESNNDYSASNPDPIGHGHSYGKYQFFSESKGAPTSGLKSMLDSSGYAKDFEGLNVGSKEFGDKWKSLAESDPKFRNAQDVAAHKQFYTPVKRAHDIILGDDTGKTNFGLQSALFASSIQSSEDGNKTILQNVLKAAGSREKWANMSKDDQVNLFYTERKKYVDKATLREVAKKKMDPKTQQNVMQRLNEQQDLALKLNDVPIDVKSANAGIGTRQMTEAEVDALLSPTGPTSISPKPTNKAGPITPQTTPGPQSSGGTNINVVNPKQDAQRTAGADPTNYKPDESNKMLALKSFRFNFAQA